MSQNYDNWERLVAAVIKKQQIWELCHQHSTTTSVCSEDSLTSDLSSVFQSDLKPIPKLLSIKEALRRSTREVGKGRFGTSLLTKLRRNVPLSDQQFLPKGTQLVMKKLFREVIVTEEEFRAAFGNCRHENVAAPRAFYFSNDENIIFNDYYIQGSAYDMLQLTRKGLLLDRPDWDSRLKIAAGAARGVAHIHRNNMAHGNLKTSNIFVNSEGYGCVSDFGLAGIMKMVDLSYHASAHELKNPSQENDVYSFGVVLLELVTGRTSMELTPGTRERPLQREMPLRIAEWALSVGPQEWRSKLFDKGTEMCYYPGVLCDEFDTIRFIERISNGDHYSAGLDDYRAIVRRYLELIEVEQSEVFRIAKMCLADSPQDRPNMSEVVLMLQNIMAASRNQNNGFLAQRFHELSRQEAI